MDEVRFPTDKQREEFALIKYMILRKAINKDGITLQELKDLTNEIQGKGKEELKKICERYL